MRRVPRAHGDEPGEHLREAQVAFVFPVPTGMNRLEFIKDFLIESVPRAHGDEPPSLFEKALNKRVIFCL